MRKLSPSEPTVVFQMRMTKSMRRFLDKQRDGASEFVRKLITKRMERAK